MSVTVELGIILAQGRSYLDSLSKYSRYVAKGEEEIETTSDHVEELRMHALEVLATREEEKETAQEEKAEEKFMRRHPG